MTSNNEETFLERAREALEAERLDDEIVERLAAARRSALDGLEPGQPLTPQHPLWSFWAPVGAFAVVVIAVALTLSSPDIPEFPYYESELQAAAADELELLEDLEFVAWMLVEEPDAG